MRGGKLEKDKRGLTFFKRDGAEASEDIGSFFHGEDRMTHIQNVTPLMDDCKKLRTGDNPAGFSKLRTMKRLASIPLIDIMKHPELMFDDRALRKYIREHPEFQTSEETGGRRQKGIIIK